MSSKTLTATVKLNISPAEKSLKKLDRLLNSVNRSLSKASATNLTKQLTNANTQANKLSTALNKVNTTQHQVTGSVGRTNSGYQKSNTLLSQMNGKLKALASTYLGIMGMKAVTGLTDTMIGSENRLNYANAQQLGSSAYNADGNYSTAVFDQTEESMNKMYASSQKVRMSYTDMMSNVAKSMVLAGDAFQNNTDNAIRFQEIMAEAYTVGGASAAEMSSSMYQLMQALGAGTLAGDELRSVREGAPLAYQAIEKYAQGVLAANEATKDLAELSLKDLAAEGVITSDMVVAAVMDAGSKMDAAFNQTKITFGQVWNQIKNAAFKAFEPIADKLSETLTKITNNGLIEKLSAVFGFVANVLLFVFDVMIWVANGIGSFINWIAENWDWLSRLILTILVAIGVTMAVVLFPQFIAWLQYIIFAISYYVWLGVTAVASALKTAAAWALAHWPLLLLIIIIVAVIAAVIWMADSFEDGIGIIVGAIMVAVAFIWNTIVGVINAIIQYWWTYFVEPWIGIIEWVLNVFNGGFDSFGDAVKNLLGNIISWFLSLGKVVTKIIDAIFGTNWTDGLNSLQDEVLSWGKNENAITISREAPNLSNIGVDRWAYGDAYDTGYDWGYTAGKALGDGFSNLTNSLTLSENDYNLSHSFDDSNVLGGIEEDTDKISDSMDLANDDLEYLRKIAEMEWRNEFTTAEIKVEMTNNNTVNSERDLDGIMEYLSDCIQEEMASVAYGVHY